MFMYSRTLAHGRYLINTCLIKEEFLWNLQYKYNVFINIDYIRTLYNLVL